MTTQTTIGNCTLYLGDCREIMKDMETPWAIVTDPPYGMEYQSARRS